MRLADQHTTTIRRVVDDIINTPLCLDSEKMTQVFQEKRVKINEEMLDKCNEEERDRYAGVLFLIHFWTERSKKMVSREESNAYVQKFLNEIQTNYLRNADVLASKALARKNSLPEYKVRIYTPEALKEEMDSLKYTVFEKIFERCFQNFVPRVSKHFFEKGIQYTNVTDMKHITRHDEFVDNSMRIMYAIQLYENIHGILVCDLLPKDKLKRITKFVNDSISSIREREINPLCEWGSLPDGMFNLLTGSKVICEVFDEVYDEISRPQAAKTSLSSLVSSAGTYVKSMVAGAAGRISSVCESAAKRPRTEPSRSDMEDRIVELVQIASQIEESWGMEKTRLLGELRLSAKRACDLAMQLSDNDEYIEQIDAVMAPYS